MPVTGSQLAYLPARAGLARSGAVRSNYFATYQNRRTLNVVITINGVNVSASVIYQSLRINQALNDAADTASFTIKPGATVPLVNRLVSIGLGDAVNLIFAGQVSRVTHRRRMYPTQDPFVDVECVDWQRLFDRRLINYEWSSTSATAIALAIVAGWTSGFTTVNVATGLPTIDYFPCTNEKPSAALRRLVNLMGGGGTYIDPHRDLHLFPSTGETGIGAPTAPLVISNTRRSLFSFAQSYDSAQQRTRVFVEGQRTRCPLGVPANSTYGPAGTIPVEDSSAFSTSGGQARIGTQLITYTSRDYPVVVGSNPVGAKLTADAAAGATSIAVDSATNVVISGSNWIRIEDQVVSFTSAGGVAISGIPASGFGSLQHAVGAGSSVTVLGMLTGVSAIAADQSANVDVVSMVQVDDTAAQTALAAVEGGDGIHENSIVDERLNEDGATARGQADIDTFKTELLSAEWETDEMNATVGGQQGIALTSPDALTATLTITDVAFSFPILNYPPRRQCQGSTVRLAQVADIIETEAR